MRFVLVFLACLAASIIAAPVKEDEIPVEIKPVKLEIKVTPKKVDVKLAEATTTTITTEQPTTTVAATETTTIEAQPTTVETPAKTNKPEESPVEKDEKVLNFYYFATSLCKLCTVFSKWVTIFNSSRRNYFH